MATKSPRKASSKRKKIKDSKVVDPKQVQSDSQLPSPEPERDVDQQDQGTTIYGHGDFQRLIFSFTVVALIVLLCHSHALTLVTRPVDHWCRPPPTFADLSPSMWKNIGIPLDEYGRPSECLAYAQPGQQPNDTETYECDFWDYDPTHAAHSARSFWDLVCRRSSLVALGNAVYMSGALLVVPLAGYLADIFGRKIVITTGVVALLTSTAATCIARVYSFFLMTKFVNSACASSIFVVSLTLLYEVAPLAYRVFYISVSCAVGTFLVDVLLLMLASFRLPWTLLQVIVLSPTVLLLLSACAVHESPVWLLVTSKFDEAQAVMLKAAIMNNMSRNVAKQTMQRVRGELSRSEHTPFTSGMSISVPTGQPRRPHVIRVLIMVFAMMLAFFSLSWSSRLRKDAKISLVALMMSAPSYVVMYLALISLGRLQFLIVVMALLGGTCSLCSIAIYAKPRLVGDVLLVFAQCCARVLVPSAYLYIAELFPTGVRSAVLCGAYASGRLGAVAASALGLLEDLNREDLKLAIVGSGLLGVVVSMLGMPETSRGLIDVRAAETDKDVLKLMQDTLETSPRPRTMRKKKAKPKP
ncbi:solute carrier family 22 member 6-like [Amblyomma americanum]